MKPFVRATCALTVGLCLAITSAHASVIIGGTRVVFPARQGEVTVRLSNQGDRPALVEAWIDRGDAHSTPDSASTPFLITPPLFRMAAHRDQSLRIIGIQGAKALPDDRESLFWLNVLEIPPKPTGAAAHKNTLQFAIRSRLKLFYRPADLPGDPLQAPEKLTFDATDERDAVTLAIHNPTPYYITISKVAFAADGKPANGASGMVAPFGDLHLTLDGVTAAPAPGTALTYTTINDYGAADAHTGVIAP